MKFGYYFLGKKIFIEKIEIKDDVIIVKKKYNYAFKDILIIKWQDSLWGFLASYPSFVIFFRDGRSITITSTIQEYGGYEPIIFGFSKGYLKLREIFKANDPGIKWPDKREIFTVIFIAGIIQLPFILIFFIYLKINIFSLRSDILFLVDGLITASLSLLKIRMDRKKFLKSLIRELKI